MSEALNTLVMGGKLEFQGHCRTFHDFFMLAPNIYKKITKNVENFQQQLSEFRAEGNSIEDQQEELKNFTKILEEMDDANMENMEILNGAFLDIEEKLEKLSSDLIKVILG